MSVCQEGPSGGAVGERSPVRQPIGRRIYERSLLFLNLGSISWSGTTLPAPSPTVSVEQLRSIPTRLVAVVDPQLLPRQLGSILGAKPRWLRRSLHSLQLCFPRPFLTRRLRPRGSQHPSSLPTSKPCQPRVESTVSFGLPSFVNGSAADFVSGSGRGIRIPDIPVNGWALLPTELSRKKCVIEWCPWRGLNPRYRLERAAS